MDADAFLPEPDWDVVISFLSRLHPQGPWHLVAIHEAGPIKARTFTRGFEDGMEAWLKRNADANIYFHVNSMWPGFEHRKARKEDVSEAIGLHIDVDDPGALDRISSFLPPPTAIVMSGGGYHAYWVLKRPTEELVRVEAINKALAQSLGGDACYSVDHLLRLPGTTNFPNAKKVAAGRAPALAYVADEHWDRRYELSDFDLNDDPGPAGPKGAVAGSPRPPFPIPLEALPTGLSELALAIINSGDDLEHPIGSSGARFPSRSEAVFHVACALVRTGCTDEFIAGVLINPNLGISASVLEKRRPNAYAAKQARSAREACGDGWPDTGKKNVPQPTFRNTVVALRRLGLKFSYDRFRERKVVNSELVEEHQGEVNDNVCVVIRSLIVEAYGFDPRQDNIFAAVNLLCLENTFHPILQMLDILAWDGTPRVNNWLSAYLGAADSPLNTAIGSIMLIAMVRRVRQPGVKFDQIVVLEGPQGSGKSTSLKILAGPENHSDQEILTQDSKTQMELMEGVWVYELGEVEGIGRAEVNKIKAFASRSVERSRMAYARFVTFRPRQAIFVGTTNDDKYLRDPTGNRRFWPVKTGAIDLQALARDRDQLLAEAAFREARGETIMLLPALWEAAAAEQAARLEEDPWIELLAAVNGVADGEMARIASSKLLQEFLHLTPDRQNQGHSKRLAQAMRKLGWEPAKFREGNKTVRGYQRPRCSDHQDDHQKQPF